MILCITEKPKVGQDLARLLGATTRHPGYFEGNGYCVTWTFGHLCTLKEPSDYHEEWKQWSLTRLPMIPEKFGIKLINQPSIKKQFDTIEMLVKQCDSIINCGDAGQEGELIQRWVMQKAGCTKPVKRLWTSSLTDEALREGLAHLREHKDLESLYLAGLCRAIGDWVLGINATRLYSLKYGRNRQILSIGRVQTPTLALVVNRQLEIENFVPKDTWEIKTLYRNVLFSSTRKPFEKKEDAEKLIAQIKDKIFVIGEVSKKKGKEAPPRLFDLTALQVECNKKYGMGASVTLQTIQSLYEKKLTTYPRVDTTYLTDDIYPKCKEILNSLKPYAKLLEPLRGAKLKKSKKVFDNSKVTDHHAIIPTGEPLPGNLSVDEKRVYHQIALRFISAFYPDCEFEQTVVNGDAGGVGFRVTGKVITNPGWKKVYEKPQTSTSASNTVQSDDEAGDNAEANTELPQFITGESGNHTPRLAKKTSQPPKYYTEGTLLKAMETAGNSVEDEDLRDALKANGIGRPSTRDAIINILYKRGYIVQERKSLRATQAGIELISLINEELLKSAKLTGIWEGRLRGIERGEYDAAEFIAQTKQMINEITQSVMSDSSCRIIETSQGDIPSSEKKKQSKTKSKPKK